jgi:hypothetical protein
MYIETAAGAAKVITFLLRESVFPRRDLEDWLNPNRVSGKMKASGLPGAEVGGADRNRLAVAPSATLLALPWRLRPVFDQCAVGRSTPRG